MEIPKLLRVDIRAVLLILQEKFHKGILFGRVLPAHADFFGDIELIWEFHPQPCCVFFIFGRPWFFFVQLLYKFNRCCNKVSKEFLMLHFLCFMIEMFWESIGSDFRVFYSVKIELRKFFSSLLTFFQETLLRKNFYEKRLLVRVGNGS